MTRPVGSPNTGTATKLESLYQFIAEHPQSTRVEMARHLGLKSGSTAHRYVNTLIQQGRVTRDRRGIVTAVKTSE